MVGFFDDENTEEFREFMSFAEEIGINGPVSFYASKVSYQIQDVAEFVGATKDKSVLIVKGFDNITLQRYKFEGELNTPNLNTFFQQYLAGTVPEYIKSEKEPSHNTDIIKIITGVSFRTLIPTKKKYLVLAVVDQDCLVCIGVGSA